MQIKTAMRYHLTPVRMAMITKSTKSKCQGECGGKETFLHYCQKCKLVQQLWRTEWKFLNKLKIEIPYDSGIPLLDTYLEKTLIKKKMHASQSSQHHYFTISKTWKQPQGLLKNEWIKKMWYIYIYIMGYYLIINNNE